MTPKRILIVDDDKGLSQMLKLNLQGTGDYEVCVENRSTDAVHTARHFRPDLILLDYVMPGMDGGDVAASLKEDPFLREVPVIMITALLANKEMSPDGTVRCGGQVMLAKPVKMADLLRCIEENLPASA